MADFTIDTLVIPATIDAPDAADFIAMTNVRNAVGAEVVGSDALNYGPAELLPNWQDPYEPQVCLVARVGDRIVARGLYMPTAEEGAKDAWLSIEVLPEFRQRGIGSALYERLVAMCEADGRTVQQSDPIHKAVEGSQQLPSPTGFGAVPLDSPETQFLLHRGFSLKQVERFSMLALPFDEDAMVATRARALAAADDYRAISWSGRTPEQWVSGLAILHQRMSTDAPSADLDSTEEAWDADRLRSLDDLRAKIPRATLTTVVQHGPTGTLVGFTELSVPPEIERPVEQQDTLVLKEHRGHRLGMLLKLENLAYLAQTHPGHPSVTTFNAEENRPMLDVNEAIGFVAVGYAGAWKKVV